MRHENRILKGDKDFHEVFENVLAYRKTDAHLPTKRIEDNTSLEEYIWQVDIIGEPSEVFEADGKRVEVFAPTAYEVASFDCNENLLKKISVRGSLREGNSSGRFYVKHLEPLAKSHPSRLFKVPDMGGDALEYRLFMLPDESGKRRNGDYFQGVPIDRRDTKQVPYANLWNFEKEFNNATNEGGTAFQNEKKPSAFLEHILTLSGVKDASMSTVLDFFAGSGTTAHAVINLNREDGGSRTYLLVEMGDYFDTVLKPRIQKVVYSKDLT